MKTDKILALILESYKEDHIDQATAIELINDLFSATNPVPSTTQPYPWGFKDPMTIPLGTPQIGDFPTTIPQVMYSANSTSHT